MCRSIDVPDIGNRVDSRSLYGSSQSQASDGKPDETGLGIDAGYVSGLRVVVLGIAEIGDDSVRILDLEIRGIDCSLLEVLGVTVGSHRHADVEAEEEPVVEVETGIHDQVVLGAIDLHPGILVQGTLRADIVRSVRQLVHAFSGAEIGIVPVSVHHGIAVLVECLGDHAALVCRKVVPGDGSREIAVPIDKLRGRIR